MPPLRQQRDRDAIRAALADGTIDALVSDHTPVGEDAKHLPFAEAEPGATGLELLLGSALKWGEASKLSLVADARGGDEPRRRAVAGRASRDGRRRSARRPACARARRRPLRVRSRRARGPSTARRCASQGQHTPFAGHEMPGRVRCTLVAGRGRLRRGGVTRVTASRCGALRAVAAARPRASLHGAARRCDRAVRCSRRSTPRRAHGASAGGRGACSPSSASPSSTRRAGRRRQPAGREPRLVARHPGDPCRRAAGALRLQGRRQGVAAARPAWSTAAGTLYLERERKRDALRVVHAGRRRAARRRGWSRCFPRGRRRPGTALLPFHANLLQAAIATGDAGAAGRAALLRRRRRGQRRGRVRRRDEPAATASGGRRAAKASRRSPGVPAAASTPARRRPARSSPRCCAPTSPPRSASTADTAPATLASGRCPGSPGSATAAAAFAAASASPR